MTADSKTSGIKSGKAGEWSGRTLATSHQSRRFLHRESQLPGGCVPVWDVGGELPSRGTLVAAKQAGKCRPWGLLWTMHRVVRPEKKRM